ncbi:hypothetical protein F5887DRAFT_915817 [Amanita rubescens]|nr:hypothetical protein F5887DRAFT_915817 [Amanita rubescens]
MNTIIFHPFNRVKSTPAHDISAALIAPVSKWYRKPTPWWVDGFEEVGLQPIVETDEIAEEEEEDVIEEQEELGAVDDGRPRACRRRMSKAMRKVAALQDIVFDDDLPGIDQDQRDDETAFLDDLMRADEGNLTSYKVSFHESDGDDTLINATFIDKVDPENDNTCSSLNANQIILTESPRNTQGVGVWPGELGSESRWVTTRTACQWLAGSLDGSGYDPGKAYLQLPDDLAVKAADVVGYPLATAVVEHDIGCRLSPCFSRGRLRQIIRATAVGLQFIVAPQLADELHGVSTIGPRIITASSSMRPGFLATSIARGSSGLSGNLLLATYCFGALSGTLALFLVRFSQTWPCFLSLGHWQLATGGAMEVMCFCQAVTENLIAVLRGGEQRARILTRLVAARSLAWLRQNILHNAASKATRKVKSASLWHYIF